MRRFAVDFIAVAAHYLGVEAVFYWLNRKAKRIVTFHNVMPKGMLRTEDESMICFSDETFARIVDEIGKRFRFSNDLKDVRTCTLTFDDGYANQLEVAGKMLRERGIPATLFLAAELKDADEPLVIDQCVVWADKVPMAAAERGFGRSFGSRVELWQQAVRPLFAADGAHRGREALKRAQVFSQVPPAIADDGRALTWTDGSRRSSNGI